MGVDSVPSLDRIAVVVYCTIVIASTAIVVVQTIAIHKAIIVDTIQIIRTGSSRTGYCRCRRLVGRGQCHHGSFVVSRRQCVSHLTGRLTQRVEIVHVLVAPTTSECRWLLLSRTKQSTTGAIVIGSTTIAIIVVAAAATTAAAIRIVVVPTCTASTLTAGVGVSIVADATSTAGTTIASASCRTLPQVIVISG